MMENLKRHLFLVVLVGAVVVLSLTIALVTYFVYIRSKDKTLQVLSSTRTRATALLSGPVFTPELVAEMAKQVDLRKKQYDDILDFIRKMGADRKPLVQGLFPATPDTGPRLNFKTAYAEKLDEFAKRLGAVPAPGTLEKKSGAEKTSRSEEVEGAMYFHPRNTFFRPDWVGKSEPPNMEDCRLGQENIWLMENLINILAKMNEELRPGDQKPSVANSPVKELYEIRIGGEFAVISGARMPGFGGRYLSEQPKPKVAAGEKVEKAEPVRAPTLEGRWSQPGFYLVLPFRMIVVVESRFSGELVRRIKGTESFLGVEAFRVKPVIEGARDVMGERKAYGSAGVVRLELVGESLVFQLEGGRVTTPPEVLKAAAALAAKP